MGVLDKTNSVELLIDNEELEKQVSSVMNEVKDVRSDLSLMANGQEIELGHEVSGLLLNILDALAKRDTCVYKFKATGGFRQYSCGHARCFASHVS